MSKLVHNFIFICLISVGCPHVRFWVQMILGKRNDDGFSIYSMILEWELTKRRWMILCPGTKLQIPLERVST